MNKLLKIVLCIGFCLMFCCLNIGYAALNDDLYVTGTVSYTPPQPAEPKPVEAGTLYYSNSKNGWTSTLPIYYDETTKTYTFEKQYAEDAQWHYFKLEQYPGKIFYLDGSNNGGNVRKLNSATASEKFLDDEKYFKISFTIDESQINKWSSLKEGAVVGSWTEISSSGSSMTELYSLDTTNVQNLSITTTESETFDLESRPNLLLTLTPDDGYLMPESFTVTIGETVYTINTNGENELETMFFDMESSTRYILGDLLPTDGSAVFVTACAVPETPPYTLQFVLENLTQRNNTADGGLYIQLNPEEGYVLPETFTLAVGETSYTVYTTAADAAGEGEPSVKDNPAGMGFDVLEGKLYIAAALLPTDGSAVTVTASGAFPPEEEPEETEPTEPEGTEPTEPEETEPTEPERKEPPATEPPSTEPPNTNEPESEQIGSETEQALE